jgi:hypothetical protein
VGGCDVDQPGTLGEGVDDEALVVHGDRPHARTQRLEHQAGVG